MRSNSHKCWRDPADVRLFDIDPVPRVASVSRTKHTADGSARSTTRYRVYQFLIETMHADQYQ